MIAEPTAHLCTCPVCGSPAQHEATPHGESYITCGHCARITFDLTAEEGESEYTALAYTGAAQAPTEPPPPDAMQEAVSLVHAMRLVPERSPRYARERAAAQAPSADVNWSEGPQESAALSPIEALRLALDRGVFGLESTVATLRASLEAADQEAITRAEQLAAARDHAAINLEMHRVEAEIFGLPF